MKFRCPRRGSLFSPSSASSLRCPALETRCHAPEPLELAPEPVHFFTLPPRRSGVSGRPECQPDATSYSSFRRPVFSHSSSPSALQSPAFSRSISPEPRSGAQHFYARARSGAPMHIPTNKIWGEYPTPPPRMRASIQWESKRCNTDGRMDCRPGETMLKIKPH